MILKILTFALIITKMNKNFIAKTLLSIIFIITGFIILNHKNFITISNAFCVNWNDRCCSCGGAMAEVCCFGGSGVGSYPINCYTSSCGPTGHWSCQCRSNPSPPPSNPNPDYGGGGGSGGGGGGGCFKPDFGAWADASAALFPPRPPFFFDFPFPPPLLLF